MFFLKLYRKRALLVSSFGPRAAHKFPANGKNTKKIVRVKQKFVYYKKYSDHITKLIVLNGFRPITSIMTRRDINKKSGNIRTDKYGKYNFFYTGFMRWISIKVRVYWIFKNRKKNKKTYETSVLFSFLLNRSIHSKLCIISNVKYIDLSYCIKIDDNIQSYTVVILVFFLSYLSYVCGFV